MIVRVFKSGCKLYKNLTFHKFNVVNSVHIKEINETACLLRVSQRHSSEYISLFLHICKKKRMN